MNTTACSAVRLTTGARIDHLCSFNKCPLLKGARARVRARATSGLQRVSAGKVKAVMASDKAAQLRARARIAPSAHNGGCIWYIALLTLPPLVDLVYF